MLVTICVCGDDALPGRHRCASCATPRERTPAKPTNPHLHTARWTRLSKRLRKQSPFCELCGSGTDLVVDHVIPLSERPDLAFEVANLRVLCRTDNASRQATCTDDERAMVLARIRPLRAM